jgi:hypothetical protein
MSDITKDNRFDKLKSQQDEPLCEACETKTHNTVKLLCEAEGGHEYVLMFCKFCRPSYTCNFNFAKC